MKGADEGVREWGAQGWPRVQLNSTFAVPPLVVKFSVASPPNNQNCMNSLTDASRNWKFDLDIFENRACHRQDHLVSRKFLVIFVCKGYICEVAGSFRTSWS